MSELVHKVIAVLLSRTRGRRESVRTHPPRSSYSTHTTRRKKRGTLIPFQHLIPLPLRLCIPSPTTGSGTISFSTHWQAIIHPERATIKRSPAKCLMSLNRTVHIQKLDMRKPSALARAAIDRDADVGAFGELGYELVQVAVGSVKGDVSEE